MSSEFAKSLAELLGLDFRLLEDILWDPSHAGHINTETLRTLASLEFVKEHDLVLSLVSSA